MHKSEMAVEVLKKLHTSYELERIADRINEHLIDIHGTYPEIKSEGHFYRHFKNAEIIECEDWETAIKKLKADSSFQVYTELDGDSTDTLWMDRGFHAVNRTGHYTLVKDSRYKVMKYSGLDK